MLAAVPIIIGAVGAGIQAIGHKEAGDAAKRAGQAQQTAYNDQGDLQDYNAQVAELQASDAVTRGAQQEDRFRTQLKGFLASERTGYAGNNVDVGFGSAVDVQADAASQGEKDARMIRLNAAREAWGFKVQAEDLRRGANISRKAGVAAEQAGEAGQTAQNFAAVGSVLSFGTSLAAQKYGFAS